MTAPRRWTAAVSDGAGVCVFCDRRDQPAPLFETPSLIAMPDRFPLAPGHVLIIPKAHVRCYGAASADLLSELDAAAARVRAFLADRYGAAVVINETGVEGQTVYHAHLHLAPLDLAQMPPEVLAADDVRPVSGWDEVRAYYAGHGRYLYLEVGGQRYLIPSFSSPARLKLREIVARLLGVGLDEHGIERTSTVDAVDDLGRRWRAWAAAGR